MEFVLRPKVATIKVTHPDGSYDMCTSASHVAELIRNCYGVPLSKFQATRLCNEHKYKRPKFMMQEGVKVTRLNSTKAFRRNTGEEVESQSHDEIYASSADQQDPEEHA